MRVPATAAVLSLVLAGVCAGEPPIEPCDSVVVAQARDAIAALRAAAATLGDKENSPQSAAYEGTVAMEGHLMRPGMVLSTKARLEFEIEPRTGGMTIRESGNNPAAIETTVIRGSRAAYQAAPDKPFVEKGAGTAGAAAAAIADAACWWPRTAVDAALAAAPTCRPGPTIKSDGVEWLPISSVDAAGRCCTLLLDNQHHLGRIERLSSDQRLGDVCDWTRFTEWQTKDGLEVPGRITRFVVLPAATLRYDLTLVSVHVGIAAEEPGALPTSRHADTPDWDAPRAASAGMEFVTLGPRVWAVEIAASDSRVLVVEREKDLVVLGAPDGDAVCSDLVNALRERFKGKPIGVVAFGHHHPASSGGLRALAAAGATIVSPRGLEEFLQGFLGRPTSLGAPAVAAPVGTKLEFFDGETTIDCGGHLSVRLIDIGEESRHAFHYVVFYLPELGVVGEDDLGYFPEGKEVKAGVRVVGLAGALERLKITPERLIQLWPVRRVRREVAWKDVAEAAKAAGGMHEP